MSKPVDQSGCRNKEARLHADLKSVSIAKGRFITQARLTWEYACDFSSAVALLQDQLEGIDLISFIERTFLQSADRRKTHCMSSRGPWTEIETIGILSTDSFDAWLKAVGKRVRQDIIRSERRGVLVKATHADDKFLRDALAIYNETPVRQGRRYTGYGETLEGLKKKFAESVSVEILAAYDENELIGILWMMCGDRVAQIGSFVHLVRKRDKLPAIALIAAAVKRCSERSVQFLAYPTAFGLQPGIDSFRLRMKFRPFAVPRYYVPLTRRGYASIRLHVHKPIQHVLPKAIARALRPIYSHISLVLPPSVLDRLGNIE